MAKRVIEIRIEGKDEMGKYSDIFYRKNVSPDFDMYDLERYVRKNFGVVNNITFDFMDDDPETGLEQWQIEGYFENDKNNEYAAYLVAQLFEIDDDGKWNPYLFTEKDIPA